MSWTKYNNWVNSINNFNYRFKTVLSTIILVTEPNKQYTLWYVMLCNEMPHSLIWEYWYIDIWHLQCKTNSAKPIYSPCSSWVCRSTIKISMDTASVLLFCTMFAIYILQISSPFVDLVDIHMWTLWQTFGNYFKCLKYLAHICERHLTTQTSELRNLIANINYPPE